MLIHISLTGITQSPIDKKPAWVEIVAVAWHQPGDKSLPEPRMVLFTDGYMHHSDPVS